MSEISLSVRNTNFLSRGLMFGGVAFIFVSLQLLPKATPLFLFAILITLVGVLIHFKTPKSKRILLGLEGDKLNHTSVANPFFSVGTLYEESNASNLDDIVYVGLEKQYVHNVGNFLHVKLYLKDIGISSIWIDSKHTDKSFIIIRETLEANKNIKIFVSKNNKIKNIFSEYNNRIIFKLPKDVSFEPWKINSSKKKLFSKDEWLQLLFAPVCIFTLVAKADGKTQAKEITVFIDELKKSEQYKSFFIAEVFAETMKSIDELFDKYKENVNLPEEGINSALIIVKNKVEKTEFISFTQSLIILSESIAQAAGERYKWVSDEEKEILLKVRNIIDKVSE